MSRPLLSGYKASANKPAGVIIAAMFTGAITSNAFSKRRSRFLLLCLALAQLLLPLSTAAAMLSAPADSPYYCGQMSSVMQQQLRSLDLPRELLQQLLPDADQPHCERCLNSVFEPLVSQAAVSLPTVFLPRASLPSPISALLVAESTANFKARAPPQ